MSKRKPLPYAANALVDDALMELAEAERALRPLMKGKDVSPEEKYRRIGESLLAIKTAVLKLQEVRHIEQ